MRIFRFSTFALLIVTITTLFAIATTRENVDVADCDALIVRAKLWPGGTEYRFADEVAPGLWVGSVCAANNEEWLAIHRVTLVVNMADEWNCVHHLTGIACVHFPLFDVAWRDASIAEIRLNAAADRIETALRAGHNVLVHCNMGVSRSVATAILYLQTYENASYDSAMNLVRSVRPIAKPNALFVELLRDRDDNVLDQKDAL